jgi:hypothetical protein
MAADNNMVTVAAVVIIMIYDIIYHI